ncbi:ComF family protein [Brevibacillus sp. TJ4]|uniref:ComF family protein n=1 Tax=Brevibacillus sp. TJ4 TaxID=3234853 RepID=UPI0037D44F53
MSGRRCARCGAGIVAHAVREGVVRRCAASFAQMSISRTSYPRMYRLVQRLPLCGGCLEEMPAIGSEICAHCGRERLQASQAAEWIVRSPGNMLCQDCRAAGSSPLRANRSLLRYNEWGKELLGLYKYRGDERLAELFASLLVIGLHCHYRPERIDSLAAVPLHVKRLRERGFNQVELVARRVSEACRIPYQQLLVRTRETKKLSQQSGRLARRESVQGAFSINGDAGRAVLAKQSAPYAILLVDDVYTTGSTLRECAKTILDSQHNEICIFSLTIFR